MSTDGFGFGLAFNLGGNALEEAKKIQDAFKGMISTTNKVGSAYISMTDKLASKSLSKLMDIGVGGLGAIGDVVNIAGDFEAQMSSIKAVTQASSSEMLTIQKEVMSASAATEFSDFRYY